MQSSTKIFRLEGSVQHYAWGGSDFIPALLRLPSKDKKPYAEYWMGAHDNASSIVMLPDQTKEHLNELIAAGPENILGEKVYQRFHRLPYLLKVLDVKDMLSIQVHPSKEVAEKAYEVENKQGIPLNAPHRNYKDDNHKPELMMALGEFWLLHGFKPPAALLQIIHKTPGLQFLLPLFASGRYDVLYKTVMSMKQEEVNRCLQPLLDRVIPLYDKGLLQKDQEDFWAARAAKTYCKADDIDRGIFSVYLFNLVKLQPGEAIFQDAGIPHAYLEGQNMELMANSDNVLRGGLTSKHIDVAELMKHTRFGPIVPDIIRGVQSGIAHEKVYLTPAQDFELREITVSGTEQVALTSITADIFFVYQGSVDVRSGDTDLSCKQGDAFLAAAGAHLTITSNEPSVVYRATVPS